MPIWVDAMCINQSDETEKMRQIQMMTAIYKGADRVMVCTEKITRYLRCANFGTRFGLEQR
jgi:hypothetical protein